MSRQTATIFWYGGCVLAGVNTALLINDPNPWSVVGLGGAIATMILSFRDMFRV